MWKLVAWAVVGFASGVVATLGWQNKGKIIGKARETVADVKDGVMNLVKGKEEKKDEPAIQGEPAGQG
jgi:hypothetical protein